MESLYLDISSYLPDEEEEMVEQIMEALHEE